MTTKRKVLVFGRGFVGSLIQKHVPADFELLLSGVDILSKKELERQIDLFSPEVIVNAAGKTNIDWCESNKEETFKVNVLGAEQLAEICSARGIFLAHFSSGCLHASQSEVDARLESDAKSPLCFYTWSKAWAEDLVMDKCKREGLKALILRPRLLMSRELSPRNSILKLLTYSQFIDVKQSATIAEDMIETMWQLIRKGAVGPYNMVNPGLISPLDVAKILRDEAGVELEINEITPDELNGFTHVKRIRTVLSLNRLNEKGIELQNVIGGVRGIARSLKDQLRTLEGQKVMAQTRADTKAKLIERRI